VVTAGRGKGKEGQQLWGREGEERTVGQSSRLELAWQTAAVTIARSSSWSMGAAAGFGIWSLGHTKEFGIAFPRVI